MKLLNYNFFNIYSAVILLGITFLFAGVSRAESSSVQVFLPGLQFRFEDTANQSRETRSYTTYSIQTQYLNYTAGFEYSSFQDETGNSTLGVSTKNKDYSIALGYEFYEYKFTDNSPRTSLNLFVKGYVGTNHTEVTTNLLNNSQTDRSEEELSFGLGAEAQIRVGYAVLAIDSRYIQSQNYSPNSVLVSTLRLGASVYFY